MTKTALLAASAVIALTGASYAGNAHTPKAGISGHFAKLHVVRTPKGSKTLYDQNGNDSGSANTSQNFESSFDAYDNQGADDFTVPSGSTWKVSEVDVTGQYRYSGGEADSANVFFYKDKKGKPGKGVSECDEVATNDSDQTGDFTMSMGKCVKKLGAGTYWVSVQANLDFFGSPAEQWYWETNTTPVGAAAMWQNPGGGFGTGCNNWGTLATCLGGSGDWMFALKGKSK